MNSSDVQRLLANGSSTTAAFATETSTAAALAEILTALANASGGAMLLGVTQRGAVRGIRNADAACNQVLSAALMISPPLVLPMPEKIQVEERTLVAIQVPPGLPNVYSLDGRYLIRDGTHNRPLQPAEIHQLMMQRGMIRFETQVPQDAALGDLDWERVRQYVQDLAQPGQSGPQEVLRQRACLASDAGVLRPTHAGLLLFGLHASRWLPNSGIMAVHYAGTEMSDRFVRQDIGGPLPDQIRQAETFLHANTTQEIVLEGLTHKESTAYPADVLREVIVNAVSHRDYTIHGDSIRVLVFDNRIQVYSPGGLPGHITLENIVRERFSRNPIIVQVLADMGFIERLGYGIDRMLKLLEETGQPAPRFEESAAGFEVTLYARARPPAIHRPRWTLRNLNPRQELAVQYVIEHQRITNREYQRLCSDVSAETIRRDLSDLVHKDILLQIGRKRATYYILKDASLAEPGDK